MSPMSEYSLHNGGEEVVTKSLKQADRNKKYSDCHISTTPRDFKYWRQKWGPDLASGLWIELGEAFRVTLYVLLWEGREGTRSTGGKCHNCVFISMHAISAYCTSVWPSLRSDSVRVYLGSYFKEMIIECVKKYLFVRTCRKWNSGVLGIVTKPVMINQDL
jgi:hypothetical protein